MGKRGRQREKLSAPTSDVHRRRRQRARRCAASLTPATRREYAALLAGGTGRADARGHRGSAAVEFLFERLAVRWAIARRRDVASRRSCSCASASRRADERAWIRDVLREHLAEWFPDVEAP